MHPRGDKREVALSGTLSFSIFPGPPGYQDVKQGDTPEPTYILELTSRSASSATWSWRR